MADTPNEDTETRRHQDGDARASRYRGTQAIRYRDKVSSSKHNTETQKQKEGEPRLDGEVTKTKKRKRGAGEEAAPHHLAIKSKGVVVYIQRRQRAVEFL